jgi:hypothetical protein
MIKQGCCLMFISTYRHTNIPNIGMFGPNKIMFEGVDMLHIKAYFRQDFCILPMNAHECR